MNGYRDALAKIGEPGADGLIPAFPSGFATAPASLREAMAAMRDAQPTLWTLPAEENVGEDWTQNCQGVARGDKHWYFSSNGSFFGGPCRRNSSGDLQAQGRRRGRGAAGP